MMHDFDFRGAAEMPRPYDPTNYGLPIWRDEDHQPPETVEAKKEQQTAESLTAEAAKNRLSLWAESQLGYHEGDGNNNKYADTPGLAEMYGWNPQNQPWCDVFVDAGFIECFGVAAACAMTYQPMGAGSALCRQSAQYYKTAGAWSMRPEIGDQVFFYASGDINHTGIVVGVDGGSVYTVEGNTSDMVAERVYSVSDSKIAGYGRPNWSVVADMKDKQTQESVEKDERHYYELRLPYLSKGSHGEAVRAVQFQLAAQGYYIGPDGADGDYGGNTEYAVKEFQRNVGLSADGTVGPDTGARLFGATVGEAPKAEKKEEVKQEVKPDTFWNNLLAKIKK